MMRIQVFFENCIPIHLPKFRLIHYHHFHFIKIAHKHTKNDVDKIRPKFGQTAIIIVSRLHSTTKLFELSYITTKTFTKPRPICSRALFKTLNPIQPCSSFYFTRVLFNTRYIYILHTLNILLFFSDINIHKTWCSLCFSAPYPLIDRFYQQLSIKVSGAQKQRQHKLL